MSIRKTLSAFMVVALSFFAITAVMATTSVTTAEAKPPPGKGKSKPAPEPSPSPSPTPAPTPTTPSVNPADAEFVGHMIPHHYQALLMSQMAPTRSNDQNLIALASQIEVEQGLEISMMQAWQSWNGLPVTDAETAYHHHLHDPMMVEQMGMATPQEMAALSAAQGTAFDVLYLQLMIRHHEGALGMIEDVLIHGSDEILAGWASDMLVTQQAQIYWMEDMLAQKT